MHWSSHHLDDGVLDGLTIDVFDAENAKARGARG
jgi:hypothetical protein